MRPSIRKYLRTCYMHLCYLTRPRNVKSAYFASFRGQYSDNPRAISETLHRLAPSVKIVWAVTEKFTPFLPPDVTAVPPASFRALCAQARANVWVLNYTERRGLGIYKGRENFYIQTWHGDRGLKTIGYLTADKKEILDGPDLKQCDLFVAASDYGVRKARQGLHYQGEVIVEGMPRNDKLLNADLHREEISRVRDTLGISPDSKVLLFRSYS